MNRHSNSRITPRGLWMGIGGGLALLLMSGAIAMPTAWFDELPRTNLRQAPIQGITLLRLVLGLLAVAIATVAAIAWRARESVTPFPKELCVSHWAPREEPDDISVRSARIGLLLVTLVALTARMYGLNADLWVDELLTLRNFVPLSIGEIVGTYQSPNNHLLNTLLIKLSIAVLGEQAWSIRLMTALFGVASVPALYRVARLCMNRRMSMGAALLLAVSYHHIFFSQNARGFVPYIFFALVATRALVDGLREQRAVHWVLFGVATVMGWMSLLHFAFVTAVEVGVVGVVIFRLRAGGARVSPLVWRMAVVFVITGLCTLALYALVLPDAYLKITGAYTKSKTGAGLGSPELLTVLLRGIADGFGTRMLLAAVPFAVLAGSGVLLLWRRQWAVTVLLLGPGVLMLVLLGSRGMTFSPRHFLLWLAPAMLCAVVTVETLLQWPRAIPQRWRHQVATATIALIASVSVLSLQRYYRVPKQPFLQTVRYLEQTRRADEVIVTIEPAGTGIEYYARREGSFAAHRFIDVSEDSSFAGVLAQVAPRPVRIVTTLDRIAEKSQGPMFARLRTGWKRDTIFAATIGDGELTVWSERPR